MAAVLKIGRAKLVENEAHPSNDEYSQYYYSDYVYSNKTANVTHYDDSLPYERNPWEFSSQDECAYYYQSYRYYAEILCNATYDRIMCWPPTLADRTASLQCPPVKGVDRTKSAFRDCSQNGLWLSKDGITESNEGWTNYTACFIPEVRNLLYQLYSGSEEDAQMKYLVAKSSRAVEIVGLSLSLVSLLVSLFVFTYFRKLRNIRTHIHKNQFVAMLLQVIVRLVLYIDQAIIKGDSSGLASSLKSERNGIDNTPIVCETFYIILEYGRSAVFMWMFIEAMYLNNLISAVFSQGPSNYTLYYIIGWGIPATMTSVWVLVMTASKTNKFCWFGYSFTLYYWILEGPRFAVIGVNLLFLLNIMRVLISKLREANSSEAQQIRPLRRSVRNALFLLPLLGITNAVTMIPKPLERSAFEFGVWSYGTNLLISFQGFVLSCIYCFFNGDVKRILCYFWRIKVTVGQRKRKMTGLSSAVYGTRGSATKNPKQKPLLYFKARNIPRTIALQEATPRSFSKEINKDRSPFPPYMMSADI